MPTPTHPDHWGALPFLRHYCSEEWLPLIRQHQQLLHCAKGDAFIRGGEKVSGIFLVNKGNVKIVSGFGGKREHILRIAGPNMLVGHRGLFSETYGISAIALTPCELTFLPRALFIQLFTTNPAFGKFMLQFLTEELHDSDEQQYILTIDNVRQRIAYCLVKLVRIFGYEKPGSRQLAYTLSRRDIATMANTTYESVIRTLSAFEKEKLIEGAGKKILVLNETKLRAIAAGE